MVGPKLIRIAAALSEKGIKRVRDPKRVLRRVNSAIGTRILLGDVSLNWNRESSSLSRTAVFVKISDTGELRMDGDSDDVITLFGGFDAKYPDSHVVLNGAVVGKNIMSKLGSEKSLVVDWARSLGCGVSDAYNS